MIAAALLAALLAAAAPEGGPPAEVPCPEDPAALEASAREVLREAAPADPEALARARELLRRARRLTRSAAIDRAAADLAFAAGDPEEGGDLLASADDADPARSSAADLLDLARRAEARRRWAEADALYARLAKAPARPGDSAGWIAVRRRELQIERAAEDIPAPSAAASGAARLALADGKRALAAGRLGEARERLQAALEESPGYVEALLALGAVETRAGRPAGAIRAYRDALASEPGRFEALTALANLLWEEPDRRRKEESLDLLDRAAARRPDVRALLRLAATRAAELGDAARALDRLNRYRAVASARERAATESLHASLARQVAAVPEDVALATEPPPDEPLSGAVDRWRKAQVFFERGDPESLAAAASLAAEAEALDPDLARAAELSAAIHEKRGEWKEAEAAIRRAIRADGTRAAPQEELARLLSRDPARAAEAEAAWRRAAEAGSPEALFGLAASRERAGRRGEALRLYRRYRDESPAGLRAEEAARAIERLEAEGRRARAAAAAAAALAIAAAAFAAWRRRSGATFAEWIARDPERTPEVRPVVGRLRHEALKHGGLLLSDAAARLETGGADARRATARLIAGRLYGAEGAPGLVAEARGALADLAEAAKRGGVRLNFRRDPVLSWVARGLAALSAAERAVRRLDRPEPSERLALRAGRRLRRAGRFFALASGAELDRALDRASAMPVRADALGALLDRVAGERGVAAPVLERLGSAAGAGVPSVRIARSDWETIWRNLFANALAAAADRPVRLGLATESRRDPAGEARVRIVLADDAAGTLAAEDLRGRPADRGFGVVAELVRRNGGSVEVAPAPAPGFVKGVALDLPAVEEGAR